MHIAGSINWRTGQGELLFYNEKEPEPEIIDPKYPSKPRRRPTTETEEQYEQRVVEWEANKPRDLEVKKAGNSMTQQYYAEHILPHYLNEINKHRVNDEEGVGTYTAGRQ